MLTLLPLLAPTLALTARTLPTLALPARTLPVRTHIRMAAALDLESAPCIIVPGFGNADVDYKTPLGQDEEVGFASVLRRRGFSDVRVLPVQRLEWARVILGLLCAIVYRPWATPEGPACERARFLPDPAHTQTCHAL